MSWIERRRTLLRKELAGLESDVATCARCYGDLPRWGVRFERSNGLPRVLLLGERPPRRALEKGERLGLAGADPGTRFLRELLKSAGFTEDDVILGAARLCRATAIDLERVVPTAVCIRECAVHVRELVRLAAPRLLVALGAEAVRSMKAAFPESEAIAGLRFPTSIGTTVDAGGTWVRVAYQTTARARATRPVAAQREDWAAIGRLWEWIRTGEGGEEGAA